MELKLTGAASKWDCEGEGMKSSSGSFPLSAGDLILFCCRIDSLGNSPVEHSVISLSGFRKCSLLIPPFLESLQSRYFHCKNLFAKGVFLSLRINAVFQLDLEG